MDEIYIFGHKKPDTDSVTSAITLSNLKNKHGIKAKPYVLGSLNKETEFVLDYFNVKEPPYLNDVKLKIKDIEYHKNYCLLDSCSMHQAYNFMLEKNITGVSITDVNKRFIGLLTIKILGNELINGDYEKMNTSYNNILYSLEGEEVLKFDDEIKGNIYAAAYKSTTILNTVKFNKNSILIVGDRHSVIEYAVNSGVKLLIIVGNHEIKESHLEIARKNHVNIIKTKFDTFHTTRLIGLTNNCGDLVKNRIVEVFSEEDYFDDFMVRSEKLGHNNYPVVSISGECLGLLRITDIINKNRKKVILVDHNETEQSALGLDEAEIVEIIDHHKLGDLTTSKPINFRNMAVGCTNTIIYNMYKESKTEISYEMAGLMMAGILSDTLKLTSPTTTVHDKNAISELAKITKLDPDDFAMEMFRAGTSLKNKKVIDLINEDLKVFNINGKKVAIAQIFTLNIDEILNNKDEYIKTINEVKINKEFDMLLLSVTDIIQNGSYFLYDEESKLYLETAFNIEKVTQGFFIDKFVSRKKQIVPPLMQVIK